MSKGRVLITGGGGFIGSHVADALLAHGYRVRALDALTAQVHPGSTRPAYLPEDVELVVGAQDILAAARSAGLRRVRRDGAARLPRPVPVRGAWNEPNNYIEWDWTVDPEWTIFAEMIACGR
jgi:nucleoside-diphosphate-sugar epimerase